MFGTYRLSDSLGKDFCNEEDKMKDYISTYQGFWGIKNDLIFMNEILKIPFSHKPVFFCSFSSVWPKGP